MKNFCITLTLLLAVFLMTAFAQTPRTISYQGVMTDDQGNLKPDGQYKMIFRLYLTEVGGNAAWTESKFVTSNKGLFTTYLGDVTAFPDQLKWDAQYWISFQVEPGIESLNRIKLGTSAYCFRSIMSDNVGSLMLPYSDSTSSANPAFSILNTGAGNGIFGESRGNTNNAAGVTGVNNNGGWGVAGFGNGYAGVFGYGGSNGNGVFGLTDNPNLNGAGVIGKNNSTGSGVFGQSSGDRGFGVFGLVNGKDANGVFGKNEGNGSGVGGYSLAASGVFGESSGNTNNAAGVTGINNNGGWGVAGFGNGFAGVFGYGGANTNGVFGLSDSPNLNGAGVMGKNNSTGSGVFGQCQGASGFGVFGLVNGKNANGVFGKNDGDGSGAAGFSVGGSGVSGESTNGFGVFGRGTTGVYGQGGTHGGSFVGNDFGVWAKANNSTGYAGYFEGKVSVGCIEIRGGCDLAEPFAIEQDRALEPGTVMVIDADHPGKLIESSSAYDRKVAGIISGAGGIKPGLVMSQYGTTADGKYLVALTGRVYCKVDASYGSVEAGDLLTTSDTPGYAMKAGDSIKAQGAIIGKAMTRLENGKGLVLVLVTLQ